LPYGSPEWVQRSAKRLDLDLTIRPRGRPRKTNNPTADQVAWKIESVWYVFSCAVVHSGLELAVGGAPFRSVKAAYNMRANPSAYGIAAIARTKPVTIFAVPGVPPFIWTSSHPTGIPTFARSEPIVNDKSEHNSTNDMFGCRRQRRMQTMNPIKKTM